MTAVGIWHSPSNVYHHLSELAEKVGETTIQNDPQYQQHRDARVAWVVALAMFAFKKTPFYLQLWKPDPPDARVMRESPTEIGLVELTLLEITRYIGKPRETLLDQLIRSEKLPKGWNKYDEKYILVVNVGIGLEPDYLAIRNYMNEVNIPFPVWAIQEIPGQESTTARLVLIDSKIKDFILNVGRTAQVFRMLKQPDILRLGRTGNVASVRREYAGPDKRAPWETIGLSR